MIEPVFLRSNNAITAHNCLSYANYNDCKDASAVATNKPCNRVNDGRNRHDFADTIENTLNNILNQ